MKNFWYSTARLIEAKDKEGKDWEVVIIKEGWSLNNKYYPKAVLKKSAKLFENVKAFAYEFKGKIWNHLPEFVRNIIPQGCSKNLVGWYDNVRYGTFRDDVGRTQEGLLARFHISENAKWLRQFMKDAFQHGKKSLLGFSIDAAGKLEETKPRNGRKAYLVNSINEADEITVVTYPGAGGQPLRLVASKNFHEEEVKMDFLKKLYEFVKGIKESAIEGIDADKITDEQAFDLMKVAVEDESILQESNKELVSEMSDKLLELGEKDKKEAVSVYKELSKKVKEAVKPDKDAEAKKAKEAKDKKAKEEKEASEKKVKEAKDKKDKEEKDKLLTEAQKNEARIKKLEEDAKRGHCVAILEELLAGSGLKETTKKKIRKMFEGKVFEKKQLEESIQVEKDYLAKLSESGDIKDLGDGKIDHQTDPVDRLQASMDLMVDEDADVDSKLKESVKTGFKGLREAYIAFHPEDPNVTGNIDRMKHLKRMTEAITTADFTYALSTSMTKKIFKDTQKRPFLYDPIVTEVPVSDFKQQQRVKWGGWSTLPTITEDAAYTDLYEPKDEQGTYTPGTKGGYVSVSRVSIKNDDLGFLKQIPSKLAKAGKKTLERDVINLLLANGTYTPTNSTVFSTLFANYAVQAMSYDSLTDSLDGISEQKERGSAQHAGTATAGASTTLTDTNSTFTDDQFNTYYLRLVYGTGAGQIRLISGTAASGSVITVSTAWTTNPDSTTRYEVSAAANDDEIMGMEGKYIIHGIQTRAKLRSILNSDKNPNNMAEDNIHKGRGLTSIYAPLITGSTYQYYWFVIVPKEERETIEVGFVDGQKTPALIVQDQPALGQVFTHDRIRFKIRYEYGLDIMDNKGIYAQFATAV